jgi:hypothetical protein
MSTNSYYSIMSAIKDCLDFCGVPCEMRPLYEGFQLQFPWCKGDIAMHDGTYGARQGNVESYCFPWDKGDVTILNPIAAVSKISEYYRTITMGF